MTKQVTPPPPGDKPAPSAPPSPPAWRHWLWPVALIAFLALWLVLPTLHSTQVTLSYSEFLSKVSAQQVKTVDLSSFLHGPVFDSLKKDPAKFRQVRVDPELGTIVWPNGADVCPDVLFHGRVPASPEKAAR